MANTVYLNGSSANNVTSKGNGELTTIQNYFGSAGLNSASVVYTDDIKPFITYNAEKVSDYISINFIGTGTFTNAHEWHLYGSWDGGTTKVQMTTTTLWTAPSGSNPSAFAKVDINQYPAPKLYIGQAAGTANSGTSGNLYITKIGTK